MYSNQRAINYPTQLHRVGHFRVLCRDTGKYECQESAFIGRRTPYRGITSETAADN
jgi:hypothetical protein